MPASLRYLVQVTWIFWHPAVFLFCALEPKDLVVLSAMAVKGSLGSFD
jgi:hypothetical protein